MGGANAQDPQGWKRPWGLWGVGLRLKEQKGPRCAPYPWSQRAGYLTWEPSRLPGLEWVVQTPSSPLLLLWSGVWEDPSCLPLLISPASFLCPHDQCSRGGGGGALQGRGPAWELSRLPEPEWAGRSPSAPQPLLPEGPSRLPLLISLASLLCPQDPRGLEGALEGGTGLGAQQAPWPKWARQSPSTPLPLLPESPSHLPLLISLASLLCPQDPRGLEGALEGGTGLGAQQAPWPKWARQSPSTPLLLLPESPSHLPLLISLASGVPILSGLHFSSHLGTPTSYRFTLGFLPCLLGGQSPPPAADRHPGCGETLTLSSHTAILTPPLLFF